MEIDKKFITKEKMKALPSHRDKIVIGVDLAKEGEDVTVNSWVIKEPIKKASSTKSERISLMDEAFKQGLIKAGPQFHIKTREGNKFTDIELTGVSIIRIK